MRRATGRARSRTGGRQRHGRRPGRTGRPSRHRPCRKPTWQSACQAAAPRTAGPLPEIASTAPDDLELWGGAPEARSQSGDVRWVVRRTQWRTTGRGVRRLVWGVRGAATEEARRALAKALGVAPSRVSVHRGARSCTKVFAAAGVDEEVARAALRRAAGDHPELVVLEQVPELEFEHASRPATSSVRRLRRIVFRRPWSEIHQASCIALTRASRLPLPAPSRIPARAGRGRAGGTLALSRGNRGAVAAGRNHEFRWASMILAKLFTSAGDCPGHELLRFQVGTAAGLSHGSVSSTRGPATRHAKMLEPPGGSRRPLPAPSCRRVRPSPSRRLGLPWP